MTEQKDFLQQLDETFFNDGYHICDLFLSMGFNKKNLFAAQKQLYKNIIAAHIRPGQWHAEFTFRRV